MPATYNSRGLNQRGFTLIEMLIALTILLVVSATVMGGLAQMSYTQGTVNNRSEMHASVRSATELLQQEIGQAGRFSIPSGTSYTLSAAVPTGTSGLSSTVALTSSSGSFPGLYNNNEELVVGTGSDQETVTVTSYDSSAHTITAVFNNVPTPVTNPVQANSAPVEIAGTFAGGVVPQPSASPTAVIDGTTVTAAMGSSGTVLKLFGDINGDGNMVYIEYTCDTAAGKLYRNSMAYTATSKLAVADSMVLLSNILPNPGGAACFTYQQKTVGAETYVVDIAVTLTVQTQLPDPTTHQYQQETKALLNVAPRNVFEGWQLASADVTSRIQTMPPNVLCLLSATPGASAACPGT